MSKVYPNRSEENSLNCYTYNIRIVSVKMKVKFQCRMKIQYDGQSLTNQVPSTEASLFLFNHQCSLVQKQNIENHFVLSISLITNKGAKYIAGVAYLYYRELARAADTGPSSRIVVALSKCLDSQAILQIIVNDAFKNGRKQTSSPPKQMNKAKINKLAINTKVDYSQIQAWKIPQNSPTNSPQAYEIKTFQSATRSQVNLNRGLSKNYQQLRNKQKKSRSKSKRSVFNYNQEKTIVQSIGSVYNKNFGAYTERSMVNLNNIEQKGEDKSLMYKESYSKLKQKLKKREQSTQREHEKRLSLQNNETTAKIEALKYKLKCEELEKNVNDKNGNIKKLQSKLQELEKLLRGELPDSNLMITKNIQMTSAKTLFNSQIMGGARGSAGTENQSGIAVLQTKVAMANKELEQLKSKMQKMQKNQQQKQTLYIKQLEKKDRRISKLQQQAFEHEKSSSTGRKAQQSIKMTIQLKNKKIQDLQQENNDVCRRLMEEQKNSKRFQKYVLEMQTKIEQFNHNASAHSSQRQKLKEQIEEQRNKRNGAELVCSGLKKNIETLENQIENYKKIKQKYHDILIDCKRIEGQHKLEIKNFESMLKAGQNNIQKVQNKYKQQMNMSNKKYQQLQTINLNQKMRIKQLQQYTTTALKSEIQNYKKNNDRLQKQCQEYRNRQRMSKKEYIQYESKIGQTNSQLEVWKNKHKSLQNMFKLEQEKSQNQITRLKSSLQKELFTQLRQKEKIEKLSGENSSLSSKYERLQQKYQKQTKQLQQKVQELRRDAQKLEDNLKKQQQMNVDHKDKSKQLQNRIKQFGSNEQQYNHIIDKYQAQLSKIKIYLMQVEQKLTNRCRQYDQLNQNYRQINDKHNNLNSKFQQISYQLKAKSSQLERQQKQKQKIQLELNNAKALIQSKDKTIESQKNNIADQALLKKQTSDQMIALKANLDSILSDYETFRLHIFDTLVGEYTGVDGLQSLAGFVIKGKDFSYGLKQSITRHATQHGYPNQRNSQRNYPSQQTKTSKSMSMKALHGNQSKQMNLLSQAGQANINSNDVISSMNQYTKQSKALLNKMIEQYRILQKQLDYTKQNYQQKQMRLKEQVKKSQMSLQRYEEQLGRVFEQKQNLEKQGRQTKEILQLQVSKTREELDKRKQEIQQLKFTNSSLNMQKQNQQEYYELKTNKLSIKINKLQQSLDSITRSYQDVKLQLNKAKIQLERIQGQNKKYKEQLLLKLNKISALQNDLNKYTSLSEQLTAKFKGMNKQIGELELMLSLERQKNSKNVQQLTQQQKKIMETKQLVSNLLKQKEAMVKQQTEKGRKIVELQEIKLYHERQLQSVRTKVQSKTSQLQKQKQQIRKSNKQLKQLEAQFSKEKQERNKLLDELKNKQKEIIALKDNTRNKDLRYTQQIDKRNKQVVQLNSDKQYVQKTYTQQVSNLNHNLNKQREKNTQLEQKLKFMNNTLTEYQKQLLLRSQNIEQKVYQINSYKQVQQKIKRIKQNQQLSIEQLTQQLRQKEEQLYNLSGQFYSLEQKYHQNLMQHKVDIEKLQEDYDYKYDTMCQDYETRIDELQKQKEYLKQKLVINQQEINKSNNKIREMEEEQVRQRTTNKEKLIKIEEQKNNIINNLKAEIKKNNDSKEKTENQIKKKEVQIQRQKNIEESDKNIIRKLQQKLKENQTKMQQTQQQCYNQAQDSRRKQMHMKQYEQSIKSYQWILQRQIKKQLQNITKFIIVNSESSENKKKVTDIIKDIQSRITKLVSDKIPHHPNN